MFKHLFLLLLLVSVSALSSAAQDPAADFYRSHKRTEGVRNFKIPGWLVWLGTGVVHDIVKSEDARVALKVARKVRKMRFLIAEEQNNIPVANVSSFVSESRRNGYADLIYVRSEDTTVNIMGQIKKNDKFKNLIIMVEEEDTFLFFHMKSNIRMKDLSEMINHYMNELPINKKSRKAEKEEAQKQKNRKAPRV